jgi:hypothetical protein
MKLIYLCYPGIERANFMQMEPPNPIPCWTLLPSDHEFMPSHACFSDRGYNVMFSYTNPGHLLDAKHLNKEARVDPREYQVRGAKLS